MTCGGQFREDNNIVVVKCSETYQSLEFGKATCVCLTAMNYSLSIVL